MCLMNRRHIPLYMYLNKMENKSTVAKEIASQILLTSHDSARMYIMPNFYLLNKKKSCGLWLFELGGHSFSIVHVSHCSLLSSLITFFIFWKDNASCNRTMPYAASCIFSTWLGSIFFYSFIHHNEDWGTPLRSGSMKKVWNLTISFFFGDGKTRFIDLKSGKGL